MKSIKLIPIHLIKPSPFNVRQSINTASLTRSMGSVGQIEPIRVRPEGDGYEIRTGMRRFLALKEAGATHVDALVVEGDDDEVVSEQWDENEEREAYTDYERALKLRQMIDVLGCTQTEIAERIGKTQGWVAQQLRIVRLEGIITPVILEKMTEYQARAILATPEEDRVTLVSHIELFFEERDAIPSASAIGDYAGDLTRLRELEKNQRRFLREIDETGYPGEPADAPVPPEVTDITSDENIQHLNEEISQRDLLPFDDKRPLLKEHPTTSAQVVATINRIVGEPAEDLHAKLVEEHGLSEEEAQAALQAYQAAYPDIWSRCYPEKTEEDEEPMTVEQYVADVLMYNPDVKPAELARVTAEMFSVSEEEAQSLIERIGKRRGRKPRDPTRPTIPCPLCGRANAEKNRLLMVLEEYEAQPGVTVVDWLREVFA